RRLEAEAALGLQARNGSVVMLVTAYVRPPDLAAAFPDAGDASRRAGVAPGHALWFARALYPGGVGEGTPRRDEMRWIVVDDWTGEVVARGTGRG
ncbi:MAG TPA: hypothetical protein VFY23_08430, partial [Candidatus Limnocylindrales bacterium]|nr:hypothetical protein [Candidatus Limnocylindrales bacterium]